MNRRRFLASAACLGAFVTLPVRARDAEIAEVLAAIGDARFVAIGERHDNPGHHALQAEIVKALQPSGLAFEMIRQSDEALVNRMRREGASRAELGEALKWEESGWPSWDHYAPILEAAPEAYIAGGGLERERLKAIHAGGLDELDPDFVALYGLRDPLPEALQTELIETQFEAHCGMMPREHLGGMVTIQRVWDAAYADALHRAAEEGGGRAVLICGNAHARLDYGAPDALLRATGRAAVSIGMMEEGDAVPDPGIFTAHLRAAKPERGDPCAPLRDRASPQ